MVATDLPKSVQEYTGNLGRTGQLGDGREEALLNHILTNTPAGNADAVVDEIDKFCSTRWMMNLGDVKGLIVDKALQQRSPSLVLELGAFCGYSAIRMGKQLKAGAQLYSIEKSSKNANIARRMVEHAGLSDTINILEGTLETTLQEVKRILGSRAFDFVFIDHEKSVYLSDLLLIVREGLIADGSVVVADNILTPGAPDYLAYMEGHPEEFITEKHMTTLEYHSDVKDMVTVSVYRKKSSSWRTG